MKLVVDTNIIAAAIVKESTTRKLLLHPDFEVYAPEHVLGELKNYRDAFIEKSGLDETEYDTLFDKIIANIMVVPRRIHHDPSRGI